jgi:hypothetical protein
MKRPVLSSWQKTNQNRLLSMKAESSDHSYPLAIRQEESKDIAGYLALIDPIGSITDEDKTEVVVKQLGLCQVYVWVL